MSAIRAVEAEQPQPIDVRERRMAPRVTTLMRAAKLVGLTGEYPCVVRDVSESGLRLKLFHPLPEQRLALELAPGIHYFVEMVWENANEAGFVCATPIDVDEFLAAIGRKEGAVWYKVWTPGALSTSTAKVPLRVSALSQQGADIETSAHLAVDDPVMLNATGLPTINARIAGRNLSGYRLIFGDAYRLDELARVIWSLPRWEADSHLELVEGGKPDKASA